MACLNECERCILVRLGAMNTVSDLPQVQPLEGRLLFTATSVDLSIVRVVAPASAIEISHRGVRGQLATTRVGNLAAFPVRPKFSIKFYLSADQTLDNSDILVGRAVSHRLVKGSGSVGIAEELQPSTRIAVGQYYLFAVLETSNGFLNSNIAGNVALAANRVSVIHGGHGNTIDNAIDGGAGCGPLPSSDNSASDNGDDSAPAVPPEADSQPSTQPASDSQPDTRPAADTQPDTRPSADIQSDTRAAPASQPATQPSADTQPDTQPATQPAPEDPAPADSTPADDSSPDDGGGSDDLSN
jgi:hypothetical protein